LRPLAGQSKIVNGAKIQKPFVVFCLLFLVLLFEDADYNRASLNLKKAAPIACKRKMKKFQSAEQQQTINQKP
jgi:hypothetical protein